MVDNTTTVPYYRTEGVADNATTAVIMYKSTKVKEVQIAQLTY